VELDERIEARIGPDDVAVRLGGDEFAVLTGTILDPDEAEQLADDLLRDIAGPLQVEELDLTVSAAIGVAVLGRDGHGIEQLLRAADQAMYTAKSSGTGRQRARDGLGQAALSRIVGGLPGAIARDELRLHYQPQVGWNGIITGFEALLRWDHPSLGWLMPRQILPAAQRAGLLPGVTLMTIRQALGDHAALASVAPEATVSVNVSARDLLGHEFVERLTSLLGASGLSPHRLTLEISEPAPFPIPAVISLFKALRRLEVNVSIHEFGAGQSSLTALAQYPGVRQIKIDPTLVRVVAEDEGVARLVRAISAAAHGFEVEVVAEGVEDVTTLARLRDLDCDRLQGFLFSPPLALDAAVAWARAWPHERDILLAL
ncbi:MAG: bifunctional diguanylate cyclase/phosphodiesterase, partial [Nocardioides sp.]|nr:bifunctional diguanylate cyclase/phosphodiesterase [Nocardioides sp.]